MFDLLRRWRRWLLDEPPPTLTEEQARKRIEPYRTGNVSRPFDADAHYRVDAIAQRALGDLEPGPGEPMEEYKARMRRATENFRQHHPEWQPERARRERRS